MEEGRRKESRQEEGGKRVREEGGKAEEGWEMEMGHVKESGMNRMREKMERKVSRRGEVSLTMSQIKFLR